MGLFLQTTEKLELHVFQTQGSWSAVELTETAAVRTIPAQVQARDNPSTEFRKWT